MRRNADVDFSRALLVEIPRMTVEELLKRQKPRRRVQGIAAALLPYEPDGRIAVDAFAKLLTSTHRAGLMNAVNMDTGYVNYLSDTEKQDVLDWTRQALGTSSRSTGNRSTPSFVLAGYRSRSRQLACTASPR